MMEKAKIFAGNHSRESVEEKSRARKHSERGTASWKFPMGKCLKTTSERPQSGPVTPLSS